jgi:ribosome-binding factor A
MSIRTEKLASVIRHAVQDVITRGLGDPRIRGLVSITHVDVTDDLAEAKVHVSVLPQKHEELTMHGLRDAAGHIQHEIGPAISARRMPRLQFVKDDSLKRQALLDAALRAGGAPEAGADEHQADDRPKYEGSHT